MNNDNIDLLEVARAVGLRELLHGVSAEVARPVLKRFVEAVNFVDVPKERPPAQAETVRLAPSRAGRIYLAGPMTGIEDYNFPAFNDAANRLRADGFHVENPADHGIVDGAEWADYLRYDIARLATCETLALLPGWSKSKGAQLEVQLAHSLGMKVMCLEGAEQAKAAGGVWLDEQAAFEAWFNGQRAIHRDYKGSAQIAWQARALLAQRQPEVGRE